MSKNLWIFRGGIEYVFFISRKTINIKQILLINALIANIFAQDEAQIDQYISQQKTTTYKYVFTRKKSN